MPPERFDLLRGLVDSPALDRPLESWRQLYDLTLAFRPDLVLELGRGYGNSTCIFSEAAHEIRCRVVSIGFDSEDAWQTRTAQRLLPVVGEDWFAPLVVLHEDLTKTDFRPIVDRSNRVLVFWDAHGTDVAGAVLGRLARCRPRTRSSSTISGRRLSTTASAPSTKPGRCGPCSTSSPGSGSIWQNEGSTTILEIGGSVQSAG